MRETVAVRVQATIKRDSPDWRLKHACPACTYKLADEEPLLYTMLYTMDGNDSLKRILRRSAQEDEEGRPGPSSELPSTRQVGGDRYLTREYVDQYARGVIQEMMNDNLDPVSKLQNLSA